jgi:multidrug efflux pump subunit AcrB
VRIGNGEAERIPDPVDGRVAFPRIEVRTEVPSLSAEDVESLVTVPLEDALAGLPSLQTIRSNSVEGHSTVVLVFKRDAALSQARKLVQERLAVRAPRLPAVARPPIILPDPSAPDPVLSADPAKRSINVGARSYETGAWSPVSSMFFPGRAREAGC